MWLTTGPDGCVPVRVTCWRTGATK